MFRYGCAIHAKLLDAAAKLSDGQLDQPLDIGMGSVRKIGAHILFGESTWLARFTGHPQTPWPGAEPDISMGHIAERLGAIHVQRDAFLQRLDPANLAQRLSYRDSKGTMFTATLHQMLIQTALHSHHHRAQLVNAMRRVGGVVVEVDYMYLVREPG